MSQETFSSNVTKRSLPCPTIFLSKNISELGENRRKVYIWATLVA